MTQIYYAPETNQLVVRGTRRLWPAESLTCSMTSGIVEIWQKDEPIRVFGPVPFTEVQNQNGVPFPTAIDAKNYLDTEFAKNKEDRYNELSSTNW